MKRLVLCLDGTWNNPYQSGERDDGTKVLKPSNPLKMARAVAETDEGTPQITYYDTGVGALGTYPGTSNRILEFVDSKLGGGFGAGFEANIEQAFTFLAHNYEEGDEVYVFGFSRGAAQARGLTRFLDWVGGVPEKGDAYFIPMYFMHYLATQGQGSPTDVTTSSGKGPNEPLRDVEITLLGVWDTVMALGSRFKASVGTSVVSRSFHVGAKPAACVQHARQALAVDEKRYDFRPEIWQGAHPHQSLEQRWFPGVHSNVGGGYVKDALANLAFRWFLKTARDLGLRDDTSFSKHYKGWPAGKQYKSYKLLYGILEAIRFRRGKGTRVLTDHAAEANLELDASVIHRLRADPAESTDLDRRYRPKNVLAYLATKPDLEAYLVSLGIDADKAELPDDVMKMIAKARA